MSPSPNSKFYHGGGGEERERFNGDLMLQEVYNVQLVCIWMKGFGMEAKDEEGEGFKEKGESFKAQKEKESRKMRGDSMAGHYIAPW